MHTKLFVTYYNVNNRILSLIWSLYNKVADIALDLSDVLVKRNLINDTFSPHGNDIDTSEID